MKALVLSTWILLIPALLLGQEIKFEDKTQKFEKVKAGEVLSFDFFYTNTGSAPLILTEVKVSCGCTKPTFSKTPLAPGERAVITVTFDTKGKYGYQDRILEVYSNSSTSPYKIRFKGVVDNKQP